MAGRAGGLTRVKQSKKRWKTGWTNNKNKPKIVLVTVNSSY